MQLGSVGTSAGVSDGETAELCPVPEAGRKNARTSVLLSLRAAQSPWKTLA